LGAPVEGLTPLDIIGLRGRITELSGGGRWAPGEYTGDTSMMLAIARSIAALECFSPKDVADAFWRGSRRGPKASATPPLWPSTNCVPGFPGGKWGRMLTDFCG
jgi:ADP-ribosylglycohydrolase